MTPPEHQDWPSEFHSERLHFRPWRDTDLPALRASWTRSVGHLGPWIPPLFDGVPDPETLSDMLENWMSRHSAGIVTRYRLSYRGTDELLGEVMLIDRREPGCLELGYWLDINALGQGYATESVRAVVELVRTKADVHLLRFRCDLDNLASIRVAELVGAVREPDRLDHDGSAVLGHWTLRV